MAIRRLTPIVALYPTGAIPRDDRLSDVAAVLCSIPGMGSVASKTQVAEMPEIGTITGEKAVH